MAHYYQIVNELKRICPENVQLVCTDDVNLNSPQVIMTQTNDSLVINEIQMQQLVVYQQSSQNNQQPRTHFIIQQDEESQTSVHQQQPINYSTEIPLDPADQLIHQHQIVQPAQQQLVLRNVFTSSQQQQQEQILMQKSNESEQLQQSSQMLIQQQQPVPTQSSPSQQHVIVQQSLQPQIVMGNQTSSNLSQQRIIYSHLSRTDVFNTPQLQQDVQNQISQQHQSTDVQQHRVLQQQQQTNLVVSSQHPTIVFYPQQSQLQQTQLRYQKQTQNQQQIQQVQVHQSQQTQPVTSPQEMINRGEGSRSSIFKTQRMTRVISSQTPRLQTFNQPLRFSTSSPASNSMANEQSSPVLVPPPLIATVRTPRARETTSGRGRRRGRQSATAVQQFHAVSSQIIKGPSNRQPSPQSQPSRTDTPRVYKAAHTQAGQNLVPTSIQQHRLISNHLQQKIIQNRAVAPTSLSSPTPPLTKYRAQISQATALNYQDIDIEESIQAVVVAKNPEPPVALNSSFGNETKTYETTLTSYYAKSPDDNRQTVKLTYGRVMPLVEFKKLQRQQQQQMTKSLPTVRNNAINQINRLPATTTSTNTKLPVLSVTVTAGTSDENKFIQTQNQTQPQHVIQAGPHNQLQIQEGDAQKSAKMLVILHNREQRLITFNLPRESCTIQELLKQVGVSFTSKTNIKCITNPCASIDYIVTVGIPEEVSTTELISAVENNLQLLNTQQTANNQSKHIEQTPTEPVKDVPVKYIPEFLAVCGFCGYCGCDHTKCERCKRIFNEKPKRIPRGKTVFKNYEEKKRQNEILNCAAATMTSIRGRGGISARGRGMDKACVKPAEIEPVILTLSSSDDEGDENSHKLIKTPSIDCQHPFRKPLPCEPIISDSDHCSKEMERENVANITNSTDKLYTSITCKAIRIGTHHYEPKEKVVFTSKGIRIVAPNIKTASDNVVLNIQTREIVKIIAHFPKTLPILFIYTLPTCGSYIRESLDMKHKNTHSEAPYYNPTGRFEPNKRIVLEVKNISVKEKSVIRTIFAVGILEEITLSDARELFVRSCSKDKKLRSDSLVKSETDNIRQILIYPPEIHGISINTEDYMCLAIDQYLNDVIIDFFSKYLHLNVLDDDQRQKTHIFSSFFYKSLTAMTSRQRQTEKGIKMTASQKRHSRVKSWTKNVNLFEKDFIIIPINEQSHWFLAIICFPQLKGPVTYDTLDPIIPQAVFKKKKIHTERKISLQIGNTTITPLSKCELESSVCVRDDDFMSERDEAESDDSDLTASDESDSENRDCEEEKPQPIKQPLILIFDSLSGASRNRVVATLRDYLTCEYKAKMTEDDSSHVFNKLTMPGHCVKVPQQNNFTDCGLYLLQYIEQFFKEPIKDYRLPIKQLVNWFETIVVTRKREEISNLLRDLVKQHNPDRLPLPEITFPTIDGNLVEHSDECFNDEQAEFDEEIEVEEEEDEELESAFDDDTEGESSSPGKVPNGGDKPAAQSLLKRTCDDRILHEGGAIRKTARLENTTT